MKLRRIAYLCVILVASVIILSYSMDVLVPFILAILLWFIIKQVRRGLRQIGWFKNHSPFWLQTAISTLLILGVGFLLISMLQSNIRSLSLSLPTYEDNVIHMIEEINARWEIDILNSAENYAHDFDYADILRALLNAFTSILGDLFMILIYLLFLLLEESIFREKLKAIYPTEIQYRASQRMLNKIDRSISSYITLKTFVSFLTGLLSYIALVIIGVKAAAFWAFLIFLLNYIPTIGSLVATAFPVIFAILQFGDWVPALYVMIIVGAIQVVIGNIVEPKVMGNSLNISSLTVILALSFWGALWGITGMILSVPITVIMILVFSEFPSTRPVAILMSEKGNVS